MKFKINYFSILIVIVLLFPILLNAREYMDQYKDTSVITSSNYFKKTFSKQEEITKIKYYIDLGRKKNRRITIGSINTETTLDIENDIAFEKIEIYYHQQMENVANFGDGETNLERKLIPDLQGENIFFTINNFDEMFGDLSITAVAAPGWKITIPNNDKATVLLENIKENLLGNHIYIFTEIQNHNKYRGRQFEIYNRDAVDFQSTLKIKDGYEFVKYNPALPFKFKTENIKSFEDYYDVYTDSAIIANQVIKNKIYFNAWLRGDDYQGTDSHKGLTAEKIINFSYTYDYQEDVNAKIVEENKKTTEKTLRKIETTAKASTNQAIQLFFISILVSLLGVIIALYPKCCRSKISSLKQFFQKLIEQYKKFRNLSPQILRLIGYIFFSASIVIKAGSIL